MTSIDHNNCYYEYKAKSTIKNKTEKAFQDLVSFIKLPSLVKILQRSLRIFKDPHEDLQGSS